MRKIFIFLAIVTCCSSCYIQKTLIVEEDLLECNTNDRVVIGITPNGKKYIALDGCGNKAPNIREYKGKADSSRIGSALICNNRIESKY